MPAKNGQPFFPSFNRGFVDAVELEEFTVSLTDLLFDVTLPEIRSQAKRSIWLLVEAMS